MTRTPQEVFSDHLAALSKRDVSLILQDFADDVTLISPQGALAGLAGVEAFYTAALGGLPDMTSQSHQAFLVATHCSRDGQEKPPRARSMTASTRLSSLTARSRSRRRGSPSNQRRSKKPVNE